MTMKEMGTFAKMVFQNITEAEKDADKIIEYANRREETCNEIRKNEVIAFKKYMTYSKMR